MGTEDMTNVEANKNKNLQKLKMKQKISKKATLSTEQVIGTIILIVVGLVLIGWITGVFTPAKAGTDDLFFCEAPGNQLRPGNSEPGVCMANEQPCPDGMTPLNQVLRGKCEDHYSDKPKCCLPEV